MFAGLTVSTIIITAFLAFYFRNAVKAIADTVEDAVLDMADATKDQISGYAVTASRDAILENQEAIQELKQLLSNPDIVRPSDFLREQRRNKKNSRRANRNK